MTTTAVPLPNGLYRLHNRASGLYGLYHADGTYHSGDLRRSPDFVVERIAEFEAPAIADRLAAVCRET